MNIHFLSGNIEIRGFNLHMFWLDFSEIISCFYKKKNSVFSYEKKDNGQNKIYTFEQLYKVTYFSFLRKKKFSNAH